MNIRLSIILTILIATSCSYTDQKKEEAKKSEEATKKSIEALSGNSSPDRDSYTLIIRHIDNRAIVYINDSTIHDSGTLDGEVNTKISLTEFVEAGMTDLKVEVYNGTPPYITASPSWKIVYDIFVNDELADFVREDSNNGKIGLVYTEEHDLGDIW